MKLQSYRPVTVREVSNVPADSDWIEDILAPVHEQLRLLTLAFQQNISTENLNGEVRLLTMRSGRPTTVALQAIKSKPLGAVPLAAGAQVQSFRAESLDVGSIRLTVGFDVSDRDVEIKVLIIGA